MINYIIFNGHGAACAVTTLIERLNTTQRKKCDIDNNNQHPIDSFVLDPMETMHNFSRYTVYAICISIVVYTYTVQCLFIPGTVEAMYKVSKLRVHYYRCENLRLEFEVSQFRPRAQRYNFDLNIGFSEIFWRFLSLDALKKVIEFLYGHNFGDFGLKNVSFHTASPLLNFAHVAVPPAPLPPQVLSVQMHV